MSSQDATTPLPAWKKILFFCLMQGVVVLLIVAGIEAYFLYGYLTFKDEYCGPFAQLDGEIGWVPKPSTTSCINGGDPADPESFSSTVHINADGARARSVSAPTPAGGLLAIGDSWTFGYGIDWKDTFAAQLNSRFGRPTALLASPAYSGAQALLLGRRHAGAVRPDTIIYLELGFWDRAVCSGRMRPAAILKPCYWVDGSGVAHLVTPPPGHVRDVSKFGLLPGGMVGAGEKTLTYFLIARPLAKIRQMLVRIGLLSGFGNDFAAWAREEDIAAIKAAHLDQLMGLAKDANAELLLIDPHRTYEPFIAGYAGKKRLIYIGAPEWKSRVGEPMSRLPPDQARVPGDGHYGPGAHALIARLIHETLQGRN